MQMSKYTEKQLAYIKKLRGVDWFACMSDDGSVARRGMDHEDEVEREGKNDPELIGMYEKYRAHILNRDLPDPFSNT
jgi:hypothetical protein